MQGHLCKPIDAAVLIQQLTHWLAHKTLHDPNISGAPISPAIAPQDELPGIDLAAALARLRGNRSLLEEVLVSFADKAAHIIPELQQAIQNQEHEAATRILHKLKGTSANLSAVRVAPLAARFETQCKQGHYPVTQRWRNWPWPSPQLITTAAHLTQAALTPQASATLLINRRLNSVLNASIHTSTVI